MRTTFIQTLTELAEKDTRIVLLTADLGYTVLEVFSQRHPDRFFNVGVAEQNMAGMATGLAEAGFIPFIYSIGTFASLRTYEFLRNGAMLHGFPVRVVGVGGGYEYSSAGLTHHSLEDVGVMRLQPAMRVIAPADFAQTRTALEATWNLPEPIYYRIGKNEKEAVRGLEGRFDLENPTLLGTGRDLLLLTMGGISIEVMKVADALREQGIDGAVGVVASVNPAPQLAPMLTLFPRVMSIEDHYIVGGLGSLAAETIAENGLTCRLQRCGVHRQAHGLTGSERYMRSLQGLNAEQLLETAVRFCTTTP